MSDQHTQDGQAQRAKRLREQIERLKSGSAIEQPAHIQSLREQIEDRSGQVERVKQAGESGHSHES
jgi:hypothetical protein